MTGNFHTLLQAPGTQPQRFLLFLHGILGSRANWRGFARKVLELRPDWGAMLVDLRGHGQRAEVPLSPPHNLDAVVQELQELLQDLQVPVAAIAGHSFGGKVATLVTQRLGAEQKAAISQLWILDSPPGPQEELRGSDTTRQVFALLPQLPEHFERRQDFVARLEAEGIEKSVAQWLATNLVIDPRPEFQGRYRFRLDMKALQSMLDDFFVRDTWPVVEKLSQRPQLQIEIRSGGRSEVFSGVQRELLEQLVAAGRVSHHEFPQAGHWLHVDAPVDLAQDFADHLPRD